MIRPRFSLRWMLIAFTLLAVIFYFCFVWPTVNAQRLVADINVGNYSRLPVFKDSIHIVDADAFLLPRSWDDALRCRRRVGVEVTRKTFYLLRSREGGLTTKFILYESGPLGMYQREPISEGRAFRRH